MAFRAFTCAATNAAGRSRLVGLLFVPAQGRHRFTVEITSPPSRQVVLGRFVVLRCSTATIVNSKLPR